MNAVKLMSHVEEKIGIIREYMVESLEKSENYLTNRINRNEQEILLIKKLIKICRKLWRIIKIKMEEMETKVIENRRNIIQLLNHVRNLIN